MPNPTRPLSALASCLALAVCLPACLFLEGGGVPAANNTTNNTGGNNTNNNVTNNTSNNVVCANACLERCEFGPDGSATHVLCEEDPVTGCFDVEVRTECGFDGCDGGTGCGVGPSCDDECVPGEASCVEVAPGEGVIESCEYDDELDCHFVEVVEICAGGCSRRQGEEGMCAPPPPDCPAGACELGERRCGEDDPDVVEECVLEPGERCPRFDVVDSCPGRLGCQGVDGEAECECNERDACAPGSYQCSGSGNEQGYDVCVYDGVCTFRSANQANAPCGPNGLKPQEPHGCTEDGTSLLICPGPDGGVCAPSEVSECPDGTVCLLTEVGVLAECVPKQ